MNFLRNYIVPVAAFSPELNGTLRLLKEAIKNGRDHILVDGFIDYSTYEMLIKEGLYITFYQNKNNCYCINGEKCGNHPQKHTRISFYEENPELYNYSLFGHSQIYS